MMGNKYINYIISIALSFVIFIACSDGDKYTGITTTETKISGIVTDSNDVKLEGAKVLLYRVSSDNEGVVDTAAVDDLTSTDGGYEFDDLDAGNYFVKALLGDSLIGSSSIVDLADGQQLVINITVVIQYNYYITNNITNNYWIINDDGEVDSLASESLEESLLINDTTIVTMVSKENSSDTLYYKIYVKDGELVMVEVEKGILSSSSSSSIVISSSSADISPSSSSIVTSSSSDMDPTIDITDSTLRGKLALGNDFGLVINRSNELWGSGHNDYGQLCNEGSADVYTPVKSQDGITYISSGRGYENNISQTFYITIDSKLYGCGEFNLKIGEEVVTNHSIPQLIAEDVAQVSAGGVEGYSSVLFIKNDGTLWAFGDNRKSQFGEDYGYSVTEPIQIDSNVIKASSGFGNSLYIKADNSLWMIGANYTLVGEYTTYKDATQIMASIKNVFSAYYYTLIQKIDGSVWARGELEYGNYPLGSDWVEIPVDNAVHFSGGHSSFQVLDKLGQIWNFSELNAPTNPMLTSVLWFEYGENQGFAISIDNELYGWGFDFQGVFGMSTPTSTIGIYDAIDPYVIWADIY